MSSTKLESFGWTEISLKVAPRANRSWSSNKVAEMNNHRLGEFPDPWPDLYRGNCMKERYSSKVNNDKEERLEQW